MTTSREIINYFSPIINLQKQDVNCSRFLFLQHGK